MSTVGSVQAAMTIAVQLLNELGTNCTYTPADTGIPVGVKVLIRELTNAELVGDFRQGDLKVEVDANSLVAVPKKFDVLEIDGEKYTVKSPSGSPRRAGDITYTYKFIIRGG